MKLGKSFDQSLRIIPCPPGLTHLIFHYRSQLNHSLVDVQWPSLLTHLAFDFALSQTLIEGQWSPQLTHLMIPKYNINDYFCPGLLEKSSTLYYKTQIY
jgi:hypothetical protein